VCVGVWVCVCVCVCAEWGQESLSCARVRACARVRSRMCVRACVSCACARACVRACVRARVRECVRARVCGDPHLCHRGVSFVVDKGVSVRGCGRLRRLRALSLCAIIWASMRGSLFEHGLACSLICCHPKPWR